MIRTECDVVLACEWFCTVQIGESGTMIGRSVETKLESGPAQRRGLCGGTAYGTYAEADGTCGGRGWAGRKKDALPDGSGGSENNVRALREAVEGKQG